MGGKKAKVLYTKGVLKPFVHNISHCDAKRALEVSAFYFDLETSIQQVASAVENKGLAVYVVGNRTVKKITLPTDQLIAEQFQKCGFRHLFTYERRISSKSMPSQNSPTNKAGHKVNTMHKEYIVVCQKNNSK